MSSLIERLKNEAPKQYDTENYKVWRNTVIDIAAHLYITSTPKMSVIDLENFLRHSEPDNTHLVNRIEVDDVIRRINLEKIRQEVICYPWPSSVRNDTNYSA